MIALVTNHADENYHGCAKRNCGEEPTANNSPAECFGTLVASYLSTTTQRNNPRGPIVQASSCEHGRNDKQHNYMERTIQHASVLHSKGKSSSPKRDLREFADANRRVSCVRDAIASRLFCLMPLIQADSHRH